MATDQERLDRLEREMAILRVELAKMREQLGQARPAQRPASAQREAAFAPPPPGAGPAGTRPGHAPASSAREGLAAQLGAMARDFRMPVPRPSRSYEEIIGRYGTMALATILVLVGVAAFLNWAIRNGLLGPTVRVVLGYLIAGGFAYGGIRIRMRGTREFGNVLMAMALGVVHLVCWSAGPLLHVLPSGVALGIGFLASVLLAEFALRHDEQMLCAIGFGGAALAPFIAGDSDGNRIALAVYGIVVVALGAAALGSRPWTYARGVIMWAVLLFTIACGYGPAPLSPPAWIAVRLWVITPIIMAAALIPFTHAEHRRSMLRVSAGAVIVGALLRADRYPGDLAALLITLAGTILIVGALDVTRPTSLEREATDAALDEALIDRSTLLDAFLIPIGLFIATVAAAPRLDSLASAAVGAAFTAGAIYMTHRNRGEPEARRYASTASLIALWIVPAALADQPFARVAGCAAMGVLLLATAERMNRPPFIVGAGGSFLTASIFALDSLDARMRFSYAPFATWASFAALVAVVAWAFGVMRMTPISFLPALDRRMRDGLREAFISGAALTAFIWGVIELNGAWNPTAATSLLIVYYAATGALALYIGRVRDVQHLRVVGLGVALWGAWKALVEAIALPNVAVRVAVFFAVAAFLIGIGYWYRRGADERADAGVAPGADDPQATMPVAASEAP